MPRKKQSKFTRCQKLATERNWCIYVWRGMMSLMIVYKRFGVNKEAIARLETALNSFYFSIDMAYQIQKDKVLLEDDEPLHTPPARKRSPRAENRATM